MSPCAILFAINWKGLAARLLSLVSMLQLQSADAQGESMALLGSPECDLPVKMKLCCRLCYCWHVLTRLYAVLATRDNCDSPALFQWGRT